jgi:hypothetical protein
MPAASALFWICVQAISPLVAKRSEEAGFREQMARHH